MASTVSTRPQYLNANTNIYTAWDLRKQDGDVQGAGVAGYEDFRVLPRQAGANMSVDVGKTTPGLMVAWARGSTRGGQGIYRVDNIDNAAPTADTYIAQLNVVVTANASGSPRLDQVVLTILDQQHAGSSNLAQIDVVAGTPTGGATLDNRSGAASIPASSILLADVIVANGETTIDAVDIRDRRQFPLGGVISPLLTDLDQVAFAQPSLKIVDGVLAQASHDNHQSAVLVYLPRRIVSATRLKFRYQQGSTSTSSNYNIGIYDASGRQIVTTGATAFAGAGNVATEASLTITTTTFEPGWYYAMIGLAALSASATVGYIGVQPHLLGGTTPSGGVAARNQGLRATSGGTTLPTTLLALTDVASLTTSSAVPPCPLPVLSVG